MKTLNFNSQLCTTKEQSERLLALGLKKETADCFWCEVRTLSKGNPIQWHLLPEYIDKYDEKHIPAWSLHRLIEVMPTVITHDDYSLILGINATCIYYADDEYAETFKAFEGNLYDSVVKCIVWLIKEGYFNKEYLQW